MEKIKKFLEHPGVSLIIALIGIFGAVFGVYAYFASIQKPDLTCFVSPTRAPIVQKGNLENFSVTYLGNQIAGDLSGAEVQIWNSGKEPIRADDILDPIVIRMGNNEPIYQTTITPTRKEIGYSYNDATNNIKIGWKIMEQNDGIKIQIIYGGGVNLPIVVDGTIVGQKHITEFHSQHSITSQFIGGALSGAVVLPCIVLITLFRDSLLKKYRGTVLEKPIRYMIVPFSAVAMIFGVVLVNSYFQESLKSPFGH